MGTGCAGSSEATIKSNTTPEQEKTARAAAGLPPAKPNETANAYVAKAGVAGRGSGFSIAPPPEAPDITDKALRARRMSQALQLLSGRGRKQSFLGADEGDTGALGGGSILGGW